MRVIYCCIISPYKGRALSENRLKRLLGKYPVIVDNDCSFFTRHLDEMDLPSPKINHFYSNTQVAKVIAGFIEKNIIDKGKRGFILSGFDRGKKSIYAELTKLSRRRRCCFKVVTFSVPSHYFAPAHVSSKDSRLKQNSRDIWGINELLSIMEMLRSKKGCPWDRNQNHESLRQYLIEEAYEVVAAIDDGEPELMKEELGDLLLQIVFHCQIARENMIFNFADVVRGISEKLRRRHPHVFKDKIITEVSDVKLMWEDIKAAEKNNDRSKLSISVDHGLPALLKAYKLQRRAADLGFDWPSIEGAIDKAKEEFDELIEALSKGDCLAIEEEVGDYLFSVVNMSRFLGVNPELALGKTVSKFVQRFEYVLTKVDESGCPIDQFSLEELDKYWDEAKKNK